MLITTKQDNMKKSPYEQAGMMDPMLTNAQGMPVDPMQSIDPMQPINVGMPGSTPVPAGVAQNLTSPTPVGGRMLSPIAPMAMKGDLDKDGKMSSYEQARQTAIEKNMSPMKVRSTDPPEKQKQIKSYIKSNMNKMSDAGLMKGVGSFKPDGKTEYNWNKKTGSVEAYDKQGPSSISGGKNPNVGKKYK
jgi:hypothetical protein|tara:strand:+ start:12572 stop:13138 length:567 start_codon:yes stop_codon:yes gene_type:complete